MSLFSYSFCFLVLLAGSKAETYITTSNSQYQDKTITCTESTCDITCNTVYGCDRATIDASASDTLTVTCSTVYACRDIQITGAKSSTVVNCAGGEGAYLCWGARIDATISKTLQVTCRPESGYTYSCLETEIVCPANPNGECTVDCIDSLYACKQMDVIVKYGDSNININCDGSNSRVCTEATTRCGDETPQPITFVNGWKCSGSCSPFTYCEGKNEPYIPPTTTSQEITTTEWRCSDDAECDAPFGVCDGGICKRACDAFDIDQYLECSDSFGQVLTVNSAQTSELAKLNERVGTLHDSQGAEITNLGGQINTVNSAQTAALGQLSDRVDSLHGTQETKIANLDNEITALSAKVDGIISSFGGGRFKDISKASAVSGNMIDGTDNNPITFKDALIIILLICNIVLMITMLMVCKWRTPNKSYNETNTNIFTSDDENQRLK